jgi:hydroxylamine reductase (hybrid-cluster protein)
MKQIVPLGILFLLSSLYADKIIIPEDKKYYISGVEFDTKTYCADFSKVIKEQAKKIQALEEEIRQLRQLQQQQLSEELEKKHQAKLKKAAQQKPVEDISNKIIISDEPIH